MIKDDKELSKDEKKMLKELEEDNTDWLFGKKKFDLKINSKKKKYKVRPVPRSDIYEPIRRNPYYILLKKNGANKDEILCGCNEECIKINKILFNCFITAKLKSSERQLFGWILLNTTGSNIREVDLNYSQIAKGLGCSRAHVYSGIHGLVEKRMIFITERDDKPTIYINTLPDTWRQVGYTVKHIINDDWNRLSDNM
jgi:hypothetical protein